MLNQEEKALLAKWSLPVVEIMVNIIERHRQELIQRFECLYENDKARTNAMIKELIGYEIARDQKNAEKATARYVHRKERNWEKLIEVNDKRHALDRQELEEGDHEHLSMVVFEQYKALLEDDERDLDDLSDKACSVFSPEIQTSDDDTLFFPPTEAKVVEPLAVAPAVIVPSTAASPTILSPPAIASAAVASATVASPAIASVAVSSATASPKQAAAASVAAPPATTPSASRGRVFLSRGDGYRAFLAKSNAQKIADQASISAPIVAPPIVTTTPASFFVAPTAASPDASAPGTSSSSPTPRGSGISSKGPHNPPKTSHERPSTGAPCSTATRRKATVAGLTGEAPNEKTSSHPHETPGMT